jgi:hypothetical protein
MGYLASIAFALAMPFLSWAAGRVFLGPADAEKKGILHDGRRFAYRAGAVLLICAFFVWATTLPWYQGLMTAVASGMVMSIGIRYGFNLHPTRKLDRNYLGVTSWDDRMFVRWFTGVKLNSDDHAEDYNDRADKTRRILGGDYREDVHRAGRFRTRLELVVALACVTPQFFMG